MITYYVAKRKNIKQKLSINSAPSEFNSPFQAAIHHHALVFGEETNIEL